MLQAKTDSTFTVQVIEYNTYSSDYKMNNLRSSASFANRIVSSTAPLFRTGCCCCCSSSPSSVLASSGRFLLRTCSVRVALRSATNTCAAAIASEFGSDCFVLYKTEHEYLGNNNNGQSNTHLS